ncbi:hypothetical protein CALVIDRAFT_603010 [Calocera viscosa TUFC12733]|uniref:Uncharacterized protein n=1 Tax=Calocera viscosa (strain TUFC12733) TaxID=1330018 RepID=A0A167GA84_CALVF|nr:hypothetical protein CALVIDRAFT_603010 [Calocera viscosa TUFC12733]
MQQLRHLSPMLRSIVVRISHRAWMNRYRPLRADLACRPRASDAAAVLLQVREIGTSLARRAEPPAAPPRAKASALPTAASARTPASSAPSSSPPPPEAQPLPWEAILLSLQKLHKSVPSSGGTRSPVVDGTLTALAGLLVVIIGGWVYVGWYKHSVLFKIEQAFTPGYDPALALDSAGGHTSTTGHVRRREQALVDRILSGAERGHYYLLLGPKGTGKGSMILSALRGTRADGAAVCEAHPDMEVFRARLGKAINFDYDEDAQFGLFQRRDPKEGGPALDIERALTKLEKFALRIAPKRGKPLVLVVNNLHQLQNDAEGRRMVRLLQQRAEVWAESGILTIVFCSDDFWPYTVLRKAANRLQVMSISDLSQAEAVCTLRLIRQEVGAEDTEQQLREAVRYTGGRLAVLNRVGRSADVVAAAKETLAREKSWLLSQIGLIPEHDDDVLDEQKWASSSWLLLREFVRLQKEMERTAPDGDRESGIAVPSIPYWRCRQLMTRGDYLEALDHANIIAIDINHDVRPDSALILQAAREVCEEPGFERMLQSVRERVDEVESLHRTRELVLKRRKGGWWEGVLGKGQT